MNKKHRQNEYGDRAGGAAAQRGPCESGGFEPKEIKAGQLPLPEAEDGRVRLAEAWSFLDCDKAVASVKLRYTPELAEGEELILCGLQHQW